MQVSGRSRSGLAPGCDRRPSLPCVVVLLLCLAVANISAAAAGTRWRTASCGRASGNDVVAVEWRPARQPRAPDSRPATSSWPWMADPSRARKMSSRFSTPAVTAHRCTTRSCGCARSRCVDVSVAADPVGPARAVLRAGVGRDVLAAGRRVRTAPPSRQPGDAAFLLADGRVLRRARLLVQRPARSARLGVLLGRRCRRSCSCRRCSCTSRSSFPSGQTAGCGATRGRTLLPAAVSPGVSPGAAHRLRAWSTPRDTATCSFASQSSSSSAELVYLAVSLVAGLAIMIRALRRVRSVTARRQLRWIVWGTALGALPFVFGYVLPFVARSAAPTRLRADARCSSGSSRSRSRRRSCATA